MINDYNSGVYFLSFEKDPHAHDLRQITLYRDFAMYKEDTSGKYLIEEDEEL
jgi:hypothetical protein